MAIQNDYLFQDGQNYLFQDGIVFVFNHGDDLTFVRPEIKDQKVTQETTYCYLFEPLRVRIKSGSPDSIYLYIDLERIDTKTGVTTDMYYRFLDYEIIPDRDVGIDLMAMARQQFDSNIYRYNNVSDIIDPLNGGSSIVSKHKYIFHIYAESRTGIKSHTYIQKLPIVGGRSFNNFVANVELPNIYTTEAELYGVDLKRWKGFPVLTTVLKDPAQTDSTPTITQTIPTEGKYPCGGYLLWKSRLGGWMNWGFDISNENPSKTYEGDLEPPMFESTLDYDGNPFVPVNYTGINNSRTLSLKALNLQNIELRAVSGITYSPAVYYVKENGDLELMRLSSSSAPLSNLASGGDFSVTLQSISRTYQKTK